MTDAVSTARSRDRRSGRLIELLSNEKSFRHRWIGSPRANRLGLHTARVRLAEACAAVRRGLLPSVDGALEQRLRRDGVLVIENALPPALYDAAHAEFRRAWDEQARRAPPPLQAARRGFGRPIANDWGYDRYDGGSLNRFMPVGPELPRLRAALTGNADWARLLRRLCGTRVTAERFELYLLVHGAEDLIPDLQRQVHCDTFHETFKLWYFFEAVGLDEGPLMYARGTHRNTPERLRWERRQILERGAGSSAFRVDAGGLAELGWAAPEPICTPPNTLVLADTRGLHCRSVARAGTVRPCIYANLRPRAFALAS